MQQNSQKISVCIATYNGGKYIVEQLHSILYQLKPYDEIVISDDSSTDNTIQLIENLKDVRIRILKNNTFFDPIFNFENALKYALGDIIFLADQDDIWMPNKVETMLLCLEKADIVLSDCHIIDQSAQLIHPSFYALSGSKQGLINNVIRNSYIGCCMAFNRKILSRVLPFPPDTPMHDWWIGLIGEMYGKTLFCKEKLIAYRRHEDNLSATGQKSQYHLYKKVSFRIILLKNLLKRWLLHV